MRARVPVRSSPYWTEKADYKTAVYWCLRYPLWKKELATLPDSSKAIQYDKDKVQSASNYDATAELAMKRVDIESKINLLESTAKIVMPECPEYLIRGVTEEDIRIEDLIASGMPFSKNLYLMRRQKFYYLIARRI